ncbi:MAG: hypothetical protein WAT16_04615, partial [Saprospiraceae bacterium]
EQAFWFFWANAKERSPLLFVSTIKGICFLPSFAGRRLSLRPYFQSQKNPSFVLNKCNHQIGLTYEEMHV